MAKIPGTAHDTTLKPTVLDAHAHLCQLASMLFTSLRKSEFPIQFFGFVTMCQGLRTHTVHTVLSTHWGFLKGVLAVARHLIMAVLIVWICKVNFRDPEQFYMACLRSRSQ